MCGLAGIVCIDGGVEAPSMEQLSSMAGALVHRGPDEFGVFRDHRAGLAHARLSIIDIATGQQPLSNENGALWIAFNGEIFNYIELREELVALGHVFATKSDTEVIVHAYEAWGIQAFERFNGQWAVALWNSNTQELVLARDRYGICPLYVCEHGGRVLFASEIKAIFSADLSIPREFDLCGLDQTFTFWSIVPPQSVFRGVYEVVPGHVLVFSGQSQPKEHCYWSPEYSSGEGGQFKGSLADAVSALDFELEQATKLRLERADVQVGCYLSGGLDSSVIAALGRRVKKDEFRTFSLRFDDSEFDETRYQRQMVELLGTQHAELVVGRKDVAEIFPDVVFHAERPILRTAPAPLFLLSKLVRDAGIKVVLTGEGADEMFAGYDIFREAKVRRFWAKHPASKIRPRLLERLYPYLARSPVAQRAMARSFFGRNLSEWREPGFSHEPRWTTTSAIKRLYSADVRSELEDYSARQSLFDTLPSEFASWDYLSQDQYIETRTLLSGYLLSSQGDRMLSANSVEGRYPFLDSGVIELANSLPPSYKLRVLDEKHVLKRVSEPLVPASVRKRKKQPYRAPDAVSFVGSTTPAWMDGLLSQSAIEEAGIFNPTAVQQLWRKCENIEAEPHRFSNTDNMALVGILSTQLLHQQFIKGSALSQKQVVFTTCHDFVDP